MISGELRREGRARACILYIDLPPLAYSHARGQPGCQAWTHGPHGLRGRPCCPPNTPECSWLWPSPFSCANLSLGSSSCLACPTCLGLPSALQVPRAVSLFSCGSWAEAGARGQPLSVPPRRGLPGEGRVLLGLCPLSQMPTPTSPRLPLQGEDRRRWLECPASPSP